MQLNTIIQGDCLDVMKEIPDKYFQLIIVDPPYYKTKGEFDFVWDSFEAYLQDVEKWALACKRVLADNGTLFWFGSSKRIAYSQVILDKHFNLENSLLWYKPDSIQYQYYSVENNRIFTTHNERFLMYSNEIDMTGLEKINEEFIKPKHPFAIYLTEEFYKAGVTIKEIAKLFPSKTGGLTGCVSNWLNGDNVITKEQYLKIRKHLNNQYLRKEYEDLRKEYEDQRRYFYNRHKYEEVMTFSQESNITGSIDHDTVKPISLYTALIETCTREGDKVLDPMAGSGTTGVVCKRFKRDFLLIEKEAKYCEIGRKRLAKEYSMFDNL